MNIWILDNPRGANLLYVSIFKREMDKDLISGLLTAFNQFTVAHFEEPIESIEMGGLRWIYISVIEYNLLFIASDMKSIPADILKARLTTIKDSFIHDYQHIWKEKKGWDVNIEIFTPFEMKLHEYYFQWQEAEIMMSLSSFYNILGVFQQLTNLVKKMIENSINEEQKQILLTKIENIFETEKNKINDESELKKISFSRTLGFNLVNVDPIKCDPEIIKKFIKNLFMKTIKTIKDELGAPTLLYFQKGKILRYIVQNFTLIRELQLDHFLLDLFLD